jgi:ribonuclease HIII
LSRDAVITSLETIEADVARLRAVRMRGTSEDIDRCVLAVERGFLANDYYRTIGDERLVAEALSLLLAAYDEELKPRLAGPNNYLADLRAIHDKLYSILDPEVELDVLLYECLDDGWPGLNRSIGCLFDDETKRRLSEARAFGSTDDRLERFSRLYLEELELKKLGDVSNALRAAIDSAIAGYRRMNRWTVQGLFTIGGSGEILGLTIVPKVAGSGSIRTLRDVGVELENAAREARECAARLWPETGSWDFTWSVERKDIEFDGDSLGLALTMGIGAAARGFDVDGYTAFTGRVQWDSGEVRSVGQIVKKVQAARYGGIRRLFVPRSNLEEIGMTTGIDVIPVSSADEVWAHLRSQTQASTGTPLGRLAEARIRELEIGLATEGIKVVSRHSRRSDWTRVILTDHIDEALVDVYFSNRITANVGGRTSNLRKKVTNACEQIFGGKLTPEGRSVRYDKYTVRLMTEREIVERYLFERGDSVREHEQNCQYRARIVHAHETVLVRQFDNGTLTVQGVGPTYDEIRSRIRVLLAVPETEESESARNESKAQVEAVGATELWDRWIGTDEAGKGDYFGPLVGAAVLVDESTVAALEAIGVKDSKALSDKRNRELAVKIRGVSGERAQVVVIPPERYNSLYDQFRSEGKNLNTLLAWAHARSLEDILQKFPQERIAVLVDKFADEHYIEEKLLAEGRQTRLELIQLPRAEANTAVAAASILARATFLEWLERLSKKYGVALPKGASNPRIIDVAREIVSRHGDAELGRVAKLHFKTTERVISSP